MAGSGLQTRQRGRQSGGSCGNDQSESPATKGPRRTYDVSRDRLTGCSSRGNVGLPRGGTSCVVLPVATGRKDTFPIACSINVGFGVGLAEWGFEIDICAARFRVAHVCTGSLASFPLSRRVRFAPRDGVIGRQLVDS